MPPTELPTIIVHSDEAGNSVFNPATHRVTIAELPDGNRALRVAPHGEQFAGYVELVPAGEVQPVDDGRRLE